MASELRMLLQRIEEESKAMQRGLVGLASVARHEFIQKKWSVMDKTFVEIVDIVGTNKACELILQCYEVSETASAETSKKPIRGYETAQVGDILVYHLRPDQKPLNNQPWYGRVTHVLPKSHQLFESPPITTYQHFWIKCLDHGYLGGEELVSGEQVVKVITREEFDQGVRDGTILLHQ